jgi:hypothetical protein
VEEYFLFDPEAAVLKPPLQGFRLKANKYVPIPRANDGSLHSEQLAMRLVAEGMILRLIDATTGERLLSGPEQAEEARQRFAEAQQQAQEEKQRAEELQRAAEEKECRTGDLEAEVVRLKAQLARTRRKR